jgi:L-lactate utilization protein LutB
MNQCIKCGSCNSVGPVYTVNEIGFEFLKYTCSNCGYWWRQPTLDAKDSLPVEEVD